MKKLSLILFTLFFITLRAQKTNGDTPGQDTVLTRLLMRIPKDLQDKFVASYKKMTPEQKGMMEFLASMPVSSKKDLIANIDTNYQNVWKLKTVYEKLVPRFYSISIEFNPPQKLLKKGESIDLKVFKHDTLGNTYPVFQEWMVELASTRLDSLLKIISWDRTTLTTIKMSLALAHCVSIYYRDNIVLMYGSGAIGSRCFPDKD